MSAKAAVRHVAGVLGEVGLPAPPPEVFRLAKHGDPIACTEMLSLSHAMVLLDGAGALSCSGGHTAASRRRAALAALSERPPEDMLAVVRWGLHRRGYRRPRFAHMSVADLDSRELLLAVGWFIAETKLLEQWVTEGSLSLWYDDGGTERLLTHYDDDVGLPVVTTVRDGPDATTSTTAVSGKGSSSGVKRSTESLPSSSTSLTTTSPASSSSALDLLRGHVYRVGRANGAVRALCGELAGRLREADRLRAADPALTPAQRLLLRSSRQQEQYAARLADANERLGRALAAEEAHHPAWWQWLATAAVDANSGVSKDDDKDSSDRERHDTDDFSSGEVAGARREFFATLAPLRDTLMLARRKWTRARQQLRSEIVRAERALAKAEMAVYDAVATGCTRCRRADGNDSRDGTVPNVLCVCAFAARPGERPPTDAVGGGGAGLVGLRRTFCVGTGARAPRGAISVAAEAERARVDFDNICAELATAAKANADLLQILLTKAPSLVLVK